MILHFAYRINSQNMRTDQRAVSLYPFIVVFSFSYSPKSVGRPLLFFLKELKMSVAQFTGPRTKPLKA